MLLTLDIEKATPGGRMLARHEGRVVLVSGAIPGERVVARVERGEKGVAFATAVDVLTGSPDRRVTSDLRCGGNALAHIAYPRQLALKAQIIEDALARIARVRLDVPPDVRPSPESGYRMRARLHVKGARIGFYREGTHELCEPAATGQLLPETLVWLEGAEKRLAAGSLAGLQAIDLAENRDASERACHLELAAVDVEPFAVLGEGLVGLSARRADRAPAVVLRDTPRVTDVLTVGGTPVRLTRDARAFFQGNRFLVDVLVESVCALVPGGPLVDLYAGVGLFGLALSAMGRGPVILVEGDPVSSTDLADNASPFAACDVRRGSVESFVADRRLARVMREASVIVDPPRTGLSRPVLDGIVSYRPPRLVYVSCDVATLARDSRRLLDAGYRLNRLGGIDLFPNTAHVESIAAFVLPGQ